eukprot:TRINITY_DN28568_c0_g1_i1.p1 TRINITY_DN28568_c0_g1~~TRINITY_DN28568_c0_g1_i1.p1  ORF type:complete len:563 (-),score=173.51 TRINITY_DN28568_c0_g1_i1:4-1692(-)
MSVAENIDNALSSLWQLALAMASLKHIADIVLQEEDLASADTAGGQEEDHSQVPDTQRHTHDEETEASADDSFANKEDIEMEEIELAALISFLTVTMVCQQNKAPGTKKVCVTEELVENDDETEPESIQISSMIGHQLSEDGPLLDISEMPLSMAAHVISPNVEDGEHMCDANIHMIRKQDKGDENYIPYKGFSERSTLTSGKPTKTNFTESEVLTSTTAENGSVHETSMCTQPCLETPLLMADYQVSMVAHQHALAQNNVKSGNLGPHQASTHNIAEQDQYKTEIEINGEEVIRDSTFSSSLLAHQVLRVDAPMEPSEFPASMVAHMIISNGNKETLIPTNENVSMVAHHLVNEEPSATEIKGGYQTVEELQNHIEDAHMTDHTSDDDGYEELSSAKTDGSEEEESGQHYELVEKMDSSYSEERNEDAPLKEENTKNHYQCKKTVGEGEEYKTDISLCDNQTQLDKIEEHQSDAEEEIDNFDVKTKNIHRISENNVGTTNIINNFKGVEFKSCITIHQQFDEEFETRDTEDIISAEGSVSSGDESIQSMLTDEKINHLEDY